MTSKLRGSRLEAEVEKARTEGNWKRLSELLTSMKSKQSGMPDMVDLIEAEIFLEQFLEKQGGILRPRPANHEDLHSSEVVLLKIVQESTSPGGIFLEAYLLLTKLHYVCAQYQSALKDIELSGMESGTTPFRTLRALRLIAEAYAIKGLCLDALETERVSASNKSLFCYEKAAELAISYVSELEKTIGSGSGKNILVTFPTAYKAEKMGDILECCLEKVAGSRAKGSDKSSDIEGVEWYRKIITCLGDKSIGERLQQKLSRQLAELLLRAFPSETRDSSRAVFDKSQNLSFYTGSQRGYFSPTSRTEEIILLLLISEILATREVVLSRNDELASSREQSIRNAKSVHNLLTLVLSTLKQYNLLSTIFERSMKFANRDSHLWQQFALSLLCRGKWIRAARVLEESIISDGADAAFQHLLAAQLHLQHLGQYDTAIIHAESANKLCSDGVHSCLRPRCVLMCALATGLRAQSELCWEDRRRDLSKAISMFEDCVHADPHDYLAFYYCALHYAIVRDLECARERCRRSLELNPDQPSAILLLALIFTADKDLKGALELVNMALKDFPNNYSLLVLRLHIQSKFGRIEESFDTCLQLLDFWRKRECTMEDEKGQLSLNAADGLSILRDGSFKTGTSSIGKEAINGTPVTPIFATSMGMGLANPMVASVTATSSGVDISDSGLAQSEIGGQSSISDSFRGVGSTGTAWAKFRAQASMWASLSELFLSEGRVADVAPCIEQAVTLFPHSHQALYLKGRLLSAKADRTDDLSFVNRFRGEAKAAFLSALALCPSHPSSLSHLATLYLKESNVQMAEQLYIELIRVDPLNCDWWQQLGCCQMQRGLSEGASKSFATASQLDRSTPLLPFSSIPLVFPSTF